MLDLEARVAEDGDVVAPCRRRDVDLARMRVVAGEEGAGDAEGAGAREGLGDRNLTGVERRRSEQDRRTWCKRPVRILTRFSFSGFESSP